MADQVLLLSYAFPPVAAAEAYLSAKAVRGLRDLAVDVISAEPWGPGVAVDHSIDDYISRVVRRVRRVLHPWWAVPLVMLPPLRRVPDALVWRNRRALRAAETLHPDRYALLLSWSQWHSVHLVALAIKRRHPGLPWAARWSDPWVDNPLIRYGPVTRALNKRLERSVVLTADRILFTSTRTRDMVMAKYDPALAGKARVIPHAFDRSLYRKAELPAGSGVVARYMGAFYGARRPETLFVALALLHRTRPELLRDLRVELVGPVPRRMRWSRALRSLPRGMVVVRPPVDYRTSLELMREADLLMVIDAPGSSSVFLPSKLIDYLGAGRPVLGITPAGTAADVIHEAGGLVADPADPGAVADTLADALVRLADGRFPPPPENYAARYDLDSVGAAFAAELLDLIRPSP